MTLLQPTRKQYIDGECSHAEYYRALAKELYLKFSADDPFIDRARECLNEGDDHLNMISLKSWDLKAMWLRNSPFAHKVFKAHGDSVSYAGMVCLYKQAARDAVEEFDNADRS